MLQVSNLTTLRTVIKTANHCVKNLQNEAVWRRVQTLVHTIRSHELTILTTLLNTADIHLDRNKTQCFNLRKFDEIISTKDSLTLHLSSSPRFVSRDYKISKNLNKGLSGDVIRTSLVGESLELSK